MPSGVAAAAASDFVSLVAGSLVHTVPNGQTAQVEFELTAGGDENHIKDGAGRVKVGTWLLVGTATDYETRLTGVGDTPDGDPLNAWIPNNNLINWGFTLSANNQERNFFGTVEIRRASDQVVLESKSLTLTVQVGTPP